MTTYYHSLDEAFRANPAKIADWGYIKCSEADLVKRGVEFFDDIEDPGPCRRAVFLGQKNTLVVLTIDSHSRTNAAIFSSSERIDNDADFVSVFPEEHSGLTKDFEVVYFGIPT
ncbi:hypothetical protein G3N96_19550 [Burkholderia sp. Se-20373]|uniref:hypothetical protein n=1 Tax=Burkholderia sp. Se-20373 TaxID=2703898 RepID=UPI001980C6F7|nr:hypothetical protein [Burkholderia sp. Se-20373]MBN3747604.1 hypothetical protein [Burkholderia sp. Se-20373]